MDLMMPDLFGSSDLDLYSSSQGLASTSHSPKTNSSVPPMDNSTPTSSPRTPTSLSSQEMDQLLYFWTTPVSMGNFSGQTLIPAEDFKFDLSLEPNQTNVEQSSSGSSPSTSSILVSATMQRSLTSNTITSSVSSSPASTPTATTTTLTTTPSTTRSPHSDKTRYTLKSFSSPNFGVKLQKALSHASLSLGNKSKKEGCLSSSTQDLSDPPAAGDVPPSKNKGFMSGSLKNISGMKLRLPLPNRCNVCGFVVGHEKVQEHGNVYHRACFKCSSLKSLLRIN